MIKMIKELLKDDKLVQERMKDKEKNDKDLIKYINDQAKKHLKSKNGGIEDEIVVGWAKHYYIEKNSNIYFFKKEVIIKVSKEEQIIKDTKAKELAIEQTKLAKKNAKDRKIKLAQLEKEKAKLDITDPFRIHTIEFKTLKIISTVPKKENDDQMGLFDL